MFGLWEERKKAPNVSLPLRNEECARHAYGGVRAITCVRSGESPLPANILGRQCY